LDAGLPHRSIKDDRYRDFDIPGDATVLANIWSVSPAKAFCGQAVSFDLSPLGR